MPAANASATWVHRAPSATASRAWRRVVPPASRVVWASHAAVDRSPVSSAMSSAAARTRNRSASARAISRDRPTSNSLFSPVVRNAGLITASSSNPSAIRSSGPV